MIVGSKGKIVVGDGLKRKEEVLIWIDWEEGKNFEVD